MEGISTDSLYIADWASAILVHPNEKGLSSELIGVHGNPFLVSNSVRVAHQNVSVFRRVANRLPIMLVNVSNALTGNIKECPDLSDKLKPPVLDQETIDRLQKIIEKGRIRLPYPEEPLRSLKALVNYISIAIYQLEKDCANNVKRGEYISPGVKISKDIKNIIDDITDNPASEASRGEIIKQTKEILLHPSIHPGVGAIINFGEDFHNVDKVFGRNILSVASSAGKFIVAQHFDKLSKQHLVSLDNDMDNLRHMWQSFIAESNKSITA